MVSARNGIYYCSVFLYGVCGRVAEGACLWHMFITAGSNPVKHPKDDSDGVTEGQLPPGASTPKRHLAVGVVVSS